MAMNFLKLLIALFTVLAGLLYWQWNVFSNGQETAKNKLRVKAIQEMIVELKESGLLQVTQTFSRLRDNIEYQIIPPAESIKWGCIQMNGTVCVSKDGIPQTYQSNKGVLRIRYSLPFRKKLPSVLLTNWSASLRDIDIAATKIRVIASGSWGGTWAAGIPLKGFKKMELIDYYVFEGKKTTVPLYWQKKTLYITAGNSMFTYYTENPKEKLPLTKIKGSFERNAPFLSLIHTSQIANKQLPGMFTTNRSMNVDELGTVLSENYYQQKFVPFLPKEAWLVDLFSAMNRKKPAETAMGKFALNELHSSLTLLEIERFEQAVNKREKVKSAIDLDRLLGNIRGQGTNFFTLNSMGSKQFNPLVFSGQRKTYINGTQVNSLDILTVGSSRLFPFFDTMRMLGYKVNGSDAQQTAEIKKKENLYRFKFDQLIFTYNGQSFGLLKNPFENKNNKIYISLNGLKSIFKVNVKETEGEIFLSDI